MPFNAIRENKTLVKISEFTVAQTGIGRPVYTCWL